MTCDHCGHGNLEEARFCGRCGSALIVTPPQPSPSEAVAPQTGQAPEERAVRLRLLKTAVYWGIALLTVLFVGGVVADIFLNDGHYTVGRYDSLYIAWIILLLSVLGACLWVGVTGRWPWTRRRVNTVLRVLLPLVPILFNGSVAAGVGYFVGSDCYDFCGNSGFATAFGVGLGVFLGAFALEGVVILAWVLVSKLSRGLAGSAINSGPRGWRQTWRFWAIATAGGAIALIATVYMLGLTPSESSGLAGPGVVDFSAAQRIP